MSDSTYLQQSYDSYAGIEDQFNDALDQSLQPRGPEMLYGLVAALDLPAGAVAVDVGCGEGRHTIELAKRFRLDALGVDPVPRHIDIATQNLAQRAPDAQGPLNAVRFEVGSAEELPVADASVDLVWCRDVLVHVEDLGAAYAEFRRVLKPAGRALVYQMFSTDRLEPGEAAWLHQSWGSVPASMQPENTEAAIWSAGLRVDDCTVLGTEWGEYGQESTGKGGLKLLRYARLLRDPDGYIQQFGQENYDIALGDCLWHVYRLIGKLSDRVYLLSAPDP